MPPSSEPSPALPGSARPGPASAADRAFAGAIPALYERLMVPMLFAPYADDLVRRATAAAPSRVLEVAAGTGVVTRGLARALPAGGDIVATDLNGPMLDQAARVGTSRPVTFQVADAQALPFEDGSFDLVVCQFGAMFFPDKPRAFAEARRVLRPGGRLLFNVWDRIEHNDFADVVLQALARRYPQDPPSFMRRVPHGYADRAAIEADLAQGGFDVPPVFETVPAVSRLASVRDVAVALCQGTPMRAEIEARDPTGLASATEDAARALAGRFGTGPGPVEGRMQAHVLSVSR